MDPPPVRSAPGLVLSGHDRPGGHGVGPRPGLLAYLTESVYKVCLQKSIPAQIRQLFLYMSNKKG